MEMGRMLEMIESQRREMAALRRQARPTSPHPGNLMPMKYSGSTDFDEYRQQFEAIASMNKWSEERRATMLLGRLEGPALSVASSSPDKTYEGLVGRLRENFSPEQAETSAMRLRTRVQAKGESLEALF